MSTLLMIDSASARDRDDAFSVTPLPDDRGWAVEVHIAGVATSWNWGRSLTSRRNGHFGPSDPTLFRSRIPKWFRP